MKKSIIKSLFIAFCIVLTINTQAQNLSIEFEKSSWSKIKAKALKKDKIIFMDAYTTWCGPCKWMAANVFTNDVVANFYNENFINVKMDMDSEEGKKLSREYAIRSYPTLLFINGDGKIVHKSIGMKKVDEFIILGKNALDPEKQLISYQDKYEKGERSGEFLIKYVEVLQAARLDFSNVLVEHFETQKDEDLSTITNWKLIYIDYKIDIDSREFQYLLNNRKNYDFQYTKDSVDTKIMDTYYNKLMSLLYARRFDYIAYESMKAEIMKSGFSRAHETILKADMRFYSSRKKWHKYASNAIIYVDVYKQKNDDTDFLNEIAWEVYENVENKQILERAMAWAKKSVELESNRHNNDTYAVLLYKLGNTEEAIKYEEESLRLAIEAKDDRLVTEFKNMIEEMKRSLNCEKFKPQPIINGIKGGEITKKDLINSVIELDYAECEEFKEIDSKITEFLLSVLIDGNLTEIKAKGNKFTEQQIKIINKQEKGSKIYIENIRLENSKRKTILQPINLKLI